MESRHCARLGIVPEQTQLFRLVVDAAVSAFGRGRPPPRPWLQCLSRLRKHETPVPMYCVCACGAGIGYRSGTEAGPYARPVAA